MTRVLLALHPRWWRDRYGEEFAVFLDDTRMTAVVVLDIVGHAVRLQAHERRKPLRFGVAMVVSAFIEVVALKAGLTTNILWAPTDPVRALALVAAIAPWSFLAYATIADRGPRSATERGRVER